VATEKAVNYCVIPAAGRSSRMGDWKALLPWGKQTVVEAAVANACAAGCQVILVCGYRGAELAQCFAGNSAVTVVHNPDWAEGMLGSVRVGLRVAARLTLEKASVALETAGPTVPGCLVAPADMPLIAVHTYHRLLERANHANQLPGSMFPVYTPVRPGEQQTGHPVWINFSMMAIIEEQTAQARLKHCLLQYSHELVPCADEGILIDMDTPQEYERWHGHALGLSINF
jgi:molybdenum cofactor cytidylyltransferase